jgi:AcrR family transcriptional regulator
MMHFDELPAELPVKQRIVARARRHFLVHGFRGVTMDDLAEELGMSKKTLYAHFPSKTALLEAVIADKFHEVEAGLNEISSAKSINFTTKLQLLLECVERQLEEIQPAFVRDMRREAPEVFRRIEDLRREKFQLHFGKLFNEGRKSGLIRKDIPANLIIEILLAAVHGVLNPHKIEELKLTPKGAFTAILRVVLEGAAIGRGGLRAKRGPLKKKD